LDARNEPIENCHKINIVDNSPDETMVARNNVVDVADDAVDYKTDVHFESGRGGQARGLSLRVRWKLE
jgi:hypothetical protein